MFGNARVSEAARPAAQSRDEVSRRAGPCFACGPMSGVVLSVRPQNGQGFVTSDFLTVGAAAEMAGVHPHTIRNWADAGKLPCIRISNGMRVFAKKDVLAKASARAQSTLIELIDKIGGDA